MAATNPWRSLAIGLFMAGCATPSHGPAAAAEAGEPLSFALPTVAGEPFDVRAFVGKVVLVDLWATWCKPCEASFPFYAELYGRHHEAGFEMVAVSVDLHDEAVTAFLAKKPVPFMVLRDPEGTLPAKLDVQTMPTAILLGRDGKVRWVHPGFVEADRGVIEAQLEAALDAQAPPAPSSTTVTSTSP